MRSVIFCYRITEFLNLPEKIDDKEVSVFCGIWVRPCLALRCFYLVLKIPTEPALAVQVQPNWLPPTFVTFDIVF